MRISNKMYYYYVVYCAENQIQDGSFNNPALFQVVFCRRMSAVVRTDTFFAWGKKVGQLGDWSCQTKYTRSNCITQLAKLSTSIDQMGGWYSALQAA